MVTRRHLSALAIAMLGLAALPAKAYAQAVTDAGCLALAAAVKAGVHDAAVRAGNGAAPPVRVARHRQRAMRQALTTRPVSCGRTAAVASAAFRDALAGLSMAVSWDDRGPMNPGDYCLSHDLAQCYPGTTELAPLSASQHLFVQDAWQGVRAGIRQQMPFGTASDITRFRADDLSATLAISLSATVERPDRRLNRQRSYSHHRH
ncbi:MAG: hypothetical protein WD078_14305 [Woeseia sp.]